MSNRMITFGCRLNAYESQAMEHQAEAAGLDGAIIINSCAVTAEAVRQARQAIRRARREHPDARIVVTGCAAQIEPDAFAAMPEVDRVLGNAEKMQASAYDFGPGESEKIRVNDIFALTETAGHLIQGFDGKARANVQIQNGCDHRCTFCIIPYGRGNSRSVPAGAVVAEVQALVDRGIAEVVLTGVDITAYGADLPVGGGLGYLVEQILAHVPALRRLRLSSLDVVEIDGRLRDLIAGEERLMPHLHLSLQAGDDMILKRMKRRHSRADAVRFCDDIRTARPDIVFGADLIAGFPTESESMFENSLKLVEECGLTWLHVFPFSPRQGTPAARMPQLPRAVVKDRAARLRALGEARRAAYLRARIGSIQSVLVEKAGLGHTPGFAPVRVSGAPPSGAILPVRITGSDDKGLHGQITGSPAA